MMTYPRYIAVSLSGDDSVTPTPACNAALVELKIQLAKTCNKSLPLMAERVVVMVIAVESSITGLLQRDFTENNRSEGR